MVIGEFLPVNNLPAQTHYHCVRPPGQRCAGRAIQAYCHQQRPVEVAHDGDVYNTNNVDLKARSHRGDINEVCYQFIASQFSTIHFSCDDVNGL